ncbi:MAG: hypothetical protein WC438_03035 [Candidatus Pacearchaeota archaeon]
MTSLEEATQREVKQENKLETTSSSINPEKKDPNLVNKVLIECEHGEGYFVRCPYMDGEKIAVNGTCEFPGVPLCPRFAAKYHENKWVDYVLCRYEGNLVLEQVLNPPKNSSEIS